MARRDTHKRRSHRSMRGWTYSNKPLQNARRKKLHERAKVLGCAPSMIGMAIASRKQKGEA